MLLGLTRSHRLISTQSVRRYVIYCTAIICFQIFEVLFLGIDPEIPFLKCLFLQSGMHAVRENRYIILTKDFEKAYKKVVHKDDQEHEFYM